MELSLHPRAAPGDRLQVWLGAFGFESPPALQWVLDGAPAVPSAALRPLQAPHPQSSAPAALTGVFEFSGPAITPGSLHQVSVQAGGVRADLSTRTLPAAVPTSLDASFNVLLLSCFHYATDKAGVGALVAELPAHVRPHLTLLLGDQVYLDLPTLQDFENNVPWLLEKFTRDYRRNWSDASALARVVAAAPSASTPDDHEYWNNFPDPAFWLQNTWSDTGRERWAEAARAVYEAFQVPQPTGVGAALELDVDPLSFFVLDCRTQREPLKRKGEDAPSGRLVPAATLAQLERWVARVVQRRRVGVIATGQSLLQPAIAPGKGAMDYSPADFVDYREIVSAIARLPDAGLPALCVTGDVHWGRLSEVRSTSTQRIGLVEVISSPASLVRTVVLDEAKKVGAALAGLFGPKKPWPLHTDPRQPPGAFAEPVLGPRFISNMIHGQKGNHVVLLSFRRRGAGVELRVSYWPVQHGPARPAFLAPVVLAPS